MKFLILVAALMSCGCAAASPDDKYAIDPRVLQVIERTKTTTQPYRAYYWNVITLPDGRTIEEWSAEFNRGRLHRVETPRDRVVADCAAKTGLHLSIDQGTIASGSNVASVACGIATEKATVAARFIGRVKTAFGPADRVEVTDAELIRTYDISDDGIILRTTFQTKKDGRPTVLVLEPQAIDRLPSAGDMFDRASLSTSFVPETYKQRQPSL